MPEQVATGGVKTFNYPKGYNPKASREFKVEIEEAYNLAKIRKEKRKKQMIWTWIIIALIVLIGISVWWFTRK